MLEDHRAVHVYRNPTTGIVVSLSWEDVEPDSVYVGGAGETLTCLGRDQQDALGKLGWWVEEAEKATSSVEAMEEFWEDISFNLPSYMNSLEVYCTYTVPSLLRQARVARARGEYTKAHDLTMAAGNPHL